MAETKWTSLKSIGSVGDRWHPPFFPSCATNLFGFLFLKWSRKPENWTPVWIYWIPHSADWSQVIFHHGSCSHCHLELHAKPPSSVPLLFLTRDLTWTRQTPSLQTNGVRQARLDLFYDWAWLHKRNDRNGRRLPNANCAWHVRLSITPSHPNFLIKFFVDRRFRHQ